MTEKSNLELPNHPGHAKFLKAIGHSSDTVIVSQEDGVSVLDTAKIPEPAPKERPLYQCKACGFVCGRNDMEAEFFFDGEDEAWSNWICPSCQTWPTSLEDGWIETSKKRNEK